LPNKSRTLAPKTFGLASARVTMKDVARAAGVTPMTVSNVINGRPNSVSAETRIRVQSEIDRLNYRPSANAQHLRLERRFSIGMIILDDDPGFLSDPFITSLVAGLGNFASEHGYSLVLHGVRPSAIDRPSLLTRVETDGVCALLSGPRKSRIDFLERIRHLRQPFILFQERIPTKFADACSISQDDFAGGRAVGLHVLRSAKRRIVWLAPATEWPALPERERGIRAAMNEVDSSAELHVLRCGDEGFAATQAALAEFTSIFGLPDAVLGGNDQMAISAMKWLQSRGCRIPDEIEVTGFNGFEVWRFSTPELTTIISPAYQMGQRAGHEIVSRLTAGSFFSRRIVLETHIKIGASTREAGSSGPIWTPALSNAFER
jgi:LacI family transcriptional regulator